MRFFLCILVFILTLEHQQNMGQEYLILFELVRPFPINPLVHNSKRFQEYLEKCDFFFLRSGATYINGYISACSMVAARSSSRLMAFLPAKMQSTAECTQLQLRRHHAGRLKDQQQTNKQSWQLKSGDQDESSPEATITRMPLHTHTYILFL